MTVKPAAFHDETLAKRGSDGRFLPGHVPPRSPGRPPAPNGITARAARLAGERLEEMFGRATAVVERELENGNAQVAQWLIDRIRPPGRSDYVRLAVAPQLETIGDIVKVSQAVLQAAAGGEISLQDAKSVQELLGRHSQIKSLEELAELRAEIENLQRSSGGPRLDSSHFPQWGKLRGDN